MVIKKNKRVLTALFIIFALGFVAPARAAEAAEDHQEEAGRILPDGVYKVVLAVDERFVWDISNGSDLDGANLQIWTDNNSDAQKFVFTYESDGYYTIANMSSSKVIECAGSSSQDGANIQQYSGNNTDAQLWKLTFMENGYYTLTCKCNGKVADVQGGIAKRGTNIQMYHLNHTKAQEFKLVEVAEEIPENFSGLNYVVACLVFAAEIAGVVGAGFFFRRSQRKRSDNKE